MYNSHNSTQSTFGDQFATCLDSKTDYTTIYSPKSSVKTLSGGCASRQRVIEGLYGVGGKIQTQPAKPCTHARSLPVSAFNILW